MPVYIIRAGETEFVKIGWTVGDPAKRLYQLQCGQHEDLRVLRIVEGERRLEALFHNHFREQKKRDEWFLFHPEMLTITAEEVARLYVPEPKWVPPARALGEPPLIHPLKRWIFEARYTLKEFGALVGASPGFISEWLSGKKMPGTQTMIRVAAVTKQAVTANDFLEYKQDFDKPARKRRAS